ncbi:hypothetical protein [Fodinibius salsisoli]|uniref:DUF975 family protein n=1 Tax=Fodinibius salsisoli TaxID=2820877 RepID=A0ABT3PMF5_9BACT|nr:hypothetical protein [Fodinibius salsisoli]MCW9707111.1 hypothetical protein [Fodinibius salsisoli]
MKQPSIDLVHLFKYSFQQYKRYTSFVIGIMVTYYVLAIVPQIYYFQYFWGNPSTEAQVISGIITVTQLFLSLGFINVMLRLVDDEHVQVSDMFNNFRNFLSYFVGYFLYMLSIILGLFLFVLPGIFIAVRFMFYPYFILEENQSSFVALQKSYYLSEEMTVELFLFGIVVITLNIVGALLFGIGILFTYPLTTMATAVVFKSLVNETEGIPSEQYQLES